ncbi:hypothetical protein [Bacillus muralis]|uniref:hypothetical protein n=1 Tax=Peribacillus muralis TaxID=264697 RepID=UPI0007D7B2BA
MIISNHAIKRFQERVTEGTFEFIKSFIQRELTQSVLLYSLNGVEKHYVRGIVYIVEKQTVITLYPSVIE